jgi:hypothetical protein
MHDGGGGFGGGPVVPAYVPGDTRRRRGGRAATGQRFAPGIACLAFVVILAIVLLVS